MGKFQREMLRALEELYLGNLEGIINLPIEQVQERQGYLKCIKDVRKMMEHTDKLIREGL